MKLWLKKYLIRILIINFFSLIYLIQTPAFDHGFFSVQSIFYSANVFLLYFFIFLEAKSSFFSIYGLDFNFYKLLINNLNNLNFEYVTYIAYENINIFYFLFFSIGSVFFLERINYNFVLKKNITNPKKVFAFSLVIIIFILTNFNTSLTHITLKTRYKHLTNTFNSDDMVGYGIKYISQYVDNSFFRNDNWFYTIK